MHAHVVGEDVVGDAVNFISRLERGDLLTMSFDYAGKRDTRAVAPNRVHVNQNQIVLWLNHGNNLPAATGGRLGQKVYFRGVLGGVDGLRVGLTGGSGPPHA